MILYSVLTSLLALTGTCLFFSVKRNIALYEKLEEVSERIESSIDLLEEQYSIIESKLKIEVFSDEPVVRDLVEDMKIAKNSVLKVAQLLDETLILENETQ